MGHSANANLPIAVARNRRRRDVRWAPSHECKDSNDVVWWETTTTIAVEDVPPPRCMPAMDEYMDEAEDFVEEDCAISCSLSTVTRRPLLSVEACDEKDVTSLHS